MYSNPLIRFLSFVHAIPSTPPWCQRGTTEADQWAHHSQGRAAQQHALRHQGPAAVGIPGAMRCQPQWAYNIWDV